MSSNERPEAPPHLRLSLPACLYNENGRRWPIRYFETNTGYAMGDLDDERFPAGPNFEQHHMLVPAVPTQPAVNNDELEYVDEGGEASCWETGTNIERAKSKYICPPRDNIENTVPRSVLRNLEPPGRHGGRWIVSRIGDNQLSLTYWVDGEVKAASYIINIAANVKMANKIGDSFICHYDGDDAAVKAREDRLNYDACLQRVLDDAENIEKEWGPSGIFRKRYTNQLGNAGGAQEDGQDNTEPTTPMRPAIQRAFDEYQATRR